MTHSSELNHKFEVEIQGVPAPVIHKIVSEALSLYYEKYEDKMTEMEHNEMIEIFHSFSYSLSNIDYSIQDGLIEE